MSSTSEPLKFEAGSLLGVLAAEYQALKAEQTQRIVLRETMLYVNILATAAIVTAWLSRENLDNAVLLAVPISTSTISWVYLHNDFVISLFQRFFATEFPERVGNALAADLVGARRDEVRQLAAETLGSWERFHRVAPQRHRRKIANTIVVLIGFVALPVASLAVAYSASFDADATEWLQAVWIGGAALTAVTAALHVLARDW